MASESTDTTVEFSGLILGFCSAALSYMGLAGEGAPQIEKNLVLARQNIEIIELLQKKTEGNLTPEEKKLIEQVLTDLRLKYAEVNRSAK